MYCMDVASTIAKLPFSISTVTLRYGEDDMSNLYSCISMCATYRAQDITLLQLNMSMPRFISRSPAYIGSSHGEEIALIDLSSLTSCPITSMVTVPAEELVLLIQL